jgi:hypothetical protein
LLACLQIEIKTNLRRAKISEEQIAIRMKYSAQIS